MKPLKLQREQSRARVPSQCTGLTSNSRFRCIPRNGKSWPSSFLRSWWRSTLIAALATRQALPGSEKSAAKRATRQRCPRRGAPYYILPAGGGPHPPPGQASPGPREQAPRQHMEGVNWNVNSLVPFYGDTWEGDRASCSRSRLPLPRVYEEGTRPLPYLLR